MTEPSLKRRIWGWFFFDWASQPYHTLLVTFVFGPYFATIATRHFMGLGMAEDAADANAQALWARGIAIASIAFAICGPILGAVADTSGRRRPWIVGFSGLYVFGAASIWWVMPDGSNLIFALVVFGVGFLGAEFALIFTNAQLPGLGDKDEIGKLSGNGFAFGYLGGLIALVLTLLFLVEQGNGKTVIGLDPPSAWMPISARARARSDLSSPSGLLSSWCPTFFG